MFNKLKVWFKNNLISLCVILGLLIFIFIKNDTSHVANESHSVDTTLRPVSTYVQDGVKHAQIPVQIITNKKEFKKATKSLRKEIKGNNKIASVETHTEGIDTIFKDLSIVDTTNKKGDSLLVFGRKDNYIDVQAVTNLNSKTGDISIKTYDTLTSVRELEKHLFKKDVWKVDIKNKSPYNTIQAGNSFELKNPRPLIDFGLQGGYNPFTNRFYGGVGASIHIFSIKTR